MNIRVSIPSIIAIYSTFVVAAAYYIEFVLGYEPCELCIVQRYPYFIIIVSSITLSILKAKSIPLTIPSSIFSKAYTAAYVIILLASLTGFSVAAYHFGIENNYWQNFSGCSDQLSGIELSATNLLDDINEIVPNCSDSLKFFGLSLSGYNAISNIFILGLCIFSLLGFIWIAVGVNRPGSVRILGQTSFLSKLDNQASYSLEGFIWNPEGVNRRIRITERTIH